MSDDTGFLIAVMVLVAGILISISVLTVTSNVKALNRSVQFQTSVDLCTTIWRLGRDSAFCDRLVAEGE